MNEEKMTAGAGRGPCESAPEHAGMQPECPQQAPGEGTGGVSGKSGGSVPDQ